MFLDRGIRYIIFCNNIHITMPRDFESLSVMIETTTEDLTLNNAHNDIAENWKIIN